MSLVHPGAGEDFTGLENNQRPPPQGVSRRGPGMAETVKILGRKSPAKPCLDTIETSVSDFSKMPVFHHFSEIFV